jgi:hypothetical protein
MFIIFNLINEIFKSFVKKKKKEKRRGGGEEKEGKRGVGQDGCSLSFRG